MLNTHTATTIRTCDKCRYEFRASHDVLCACGGTAAPLPKTETVTVECKDCDGHGSTNERKRCSCCSSTDHWSTLCYSDCPTCKGDGEVELTIAFGLESDERDDAIDEAFCGARAVRS